MTIGELCNREVVVAERTETVVEAAKLMRRHHVGDLVVVEERSGQRVPVGIVTDRDLVVEVVAEEVAPGQVTVGDVMSTELITVFEHQDAADAMERMRSGGVRRIPVVDDQGVLQGIITVDDLVDLFAEQMQELAKLIRRERQREQDNRSMP
ncbi:MAG: CBS domain-containing protein [Gammaproteobacteria bacterium]